MCVLSTLSPIIAGRTGRAFGAAVVRANSPISLYVLAPRGIFPCGDKIAVVNPHPVTATAPLTVAATYRAGAGRLVAVALTAPDAPR